MKKIININQTRLVFLEQMKNGHPTIIDLFPNMKESKYEGGESHIKGILTLLQEVIEKEIGPRHRELAKEWIIEIALAPILPDHTYDYEVCHCDCHLDDSTRHCMPCCHECPICKKNIQTGHFYEHTLRCGKE